MIIDPAEVNALREFRDLIPLAAVSQDREATFPAATLDCARVTRMVLWGLDRQFGSSGQQVIW